MYANKLYWGTIKCVGVWACFSHLERIDNSASYLERQQPLKRKPNSLERTLWCPWGKWKNDQNPGESDRP